MIDLFFIMFAFVPLKKDSTTTIAKVKAKNRTLSAT